MYGPDYHYDTSDYPEPKCDECGKAEGSCDCLQCDVCEKLDRFDRTTVESHPTHGDSIIKSTFYCSSCWKKKEAARG